MSEESKSDSIKTPIATATAQVTSPAGKTLGELKQTISSDGMPGIPGLGKLYIALGLVGTLIVVFAWVILVNQSNATAAINNTQRIMDGQLTRLTTELSEARKEAAAERSAMVQRYIDGRETAENRHRLIEMQLSKIMTFIERLFDVMFSQKMKNKD